MAEKMERTDEHGADSPAAHELSIQLWSRRPVCGPRTTVIDRFTDLDANGRISDFAIETWPEEVPMSQTGGHGEVLDTVEQYEQWANDHGLSLRPPLETRTSSLLVGGSTEVLRLPMLAVAAYDDDELVGVYPCTDDGTTWSVTDFIDALDDGLPAFPHETGP